MKNLIPIAIYIVGPNGLGKDEINWLGGEVRVSLDKYDEALIPLETDIVNEDQLPLGILGPVDCLNYINEDGDEDVVDKMLTQLLDYCALNEMVQFVYWHRGDKCFYVKDIHGNVILLQEFVELMDALDELTTHLNEMGNMYSQENCAPDCDACPFGSLCPGYEPTPEVYVNVHIPIGIELLIHEIVID